MRSSMPPACSTTRCSPDSPPSARRRFYGSRSAAPPTSTNSPVVRGSRPSCCSHRLRPSSEGLGWATRSEEHTSELQSRGHLVCRLLLEKKKKWQLCYLTLD